MRSFVEKGQVKKICFIIAFLVLWFTSCKENFQVWKDANESFLETTVKNNDLGLDNSGIYMKEIVGGYGARPNRNSLVKIRYKAVMADGTDFTSIDTMGYVLNYPIGVQNALLQMDRESKWRICLPCELGYGEFGTKDVYGNYVVPPFSTLFFKELELVEVVQ